MSIETSVQAEGPTFTGTPDDWWESAERITIAEAQNRTLGNWYIVLVRTAGDTKPGYRVSTPSKPANEDKLRRDRAHPLNAGESDRVRLLIRGAQEAPAWMTSELVIADTAKGDEVMRLPWIRKPSGRWQNLIDGRTNINDHAMAELNPAPARITEDLL